MWIELIYIPFGLNLISIDSALYWLFFLLTAGVLFANFPNPVRLGCQILLKSNKICLDHRGAIMSARVICPVAYKPEASVGNIYHIGIPTVRYI